MQYFWYIFFGLAPSTIWLLIFLITDPHPESKRMILRVFFYGILAALAVVLILGTGDVLFKLLLNFLNVFFNVPVNILKTTALATGILITITISPILEEIFKYLVVRLGVIYHSEFDEPVDAMIYMIVAALGLAAAENMLFLFLGLVEFDLLIFAAMRFVGATILHALCSALVGYYLALSFFNLKDKTKLIRKGILLAILLHGLFNFSIIMIGEGANMLDYQQFAALGIVLIFVFSITLISLLVGLAVFIIHGFRKVKKLKSVCKI